MEPSTSPFGAPVLFVNKPDGSLRMRVDWRALNSVTVKNRFPIPRIDDLIPRIDDLLDKLAGSAFYSSFDLQQAYHQISLCPFVDPKTAFRTPFGHFQIRVLMEGLTNAPATFSAVLHRIFALMGLPTTAAGPGLGPWAWLRSSQGFCDTLPGRHLCSFSQP